MVLFVIIKFAEALQHYFKDGKVKLPFPSCTKVIKPFLLIRYEDYSFCIYH
jgi:hypothetical protein